VAFNPGFRDHILDLLAPLGVRARSMFGGVGFFANDKMFGLIADDRLYFKVDPINRSDYEAAGSAPWVYESPGGRRMPMPYWGVPDHLLEDAGALQDWAEKAIAAANRSKPGAGRKNSARRKRSPAKRR
jgi:DNA transformation protein